MDRISNLIKVIIIIFQNPHQDSEDGTATGYMDPSALTGVTT